MTTTPTILTPADVEQRVRAVFEIWNTLDPDRIADLYSFGHGFGYRTREPRAPHPSRESYLKSLHMWLAALDSYQIVIDELHTLADGNVGVAWGYYHEEFHPRGGKPDGMRGRFSEVIKRDSAGWHTLFYHREATPFDGRGMYIPPPSPPQG